MTRRFELPEDLDPDEERAVLAALERHFAREPQRLDAWTLAGRMGATGMGSLQVKRLTDRPWRIRGRFARYGVEPLNGRSDAR